MRVIITGGTGFIGKHVVNELLKNSNIEILVIGSDLNKFQKCYFPNKVKFIQYNLNDELTENIIFELKKFDTLIHLAWQGLPNYNSLLHIEVNLMSQYKFIKNIVNIGIQNIVITGTCMEYGLQNGELATSLPTFPITSYSIAKDTLHKFIKLLKVDYNFNLKWLRLFYMYGEGQSESSIFSLLKKSVELGDATFKMSGGEQLRDYLPVEDVSSMIVKYALNSNIDGVFNICSGKPISIRNLIEKIISDNNYKIDLELGYYPYLNYEPMAFWGKK